MQQALSKKMGLFFYLTILTILFILLEVSFSIQHSGFYLGDFKLISDRLQVPMSIIPGVLYFLFAQLSVHFSFTVLVWGLARLIGVACCFSEKQIEKSGIILWFFCLLTAFVANFYLYPNSRFAGLLQSILPWGAAKIVLMVLLSLLLGVVLTATVGIIKILPKKIGLVALGVVAFTTAASYHKPVITDAATAAQPNIIIIGMDSLRPDFLGYFGYEQRTPHIDRFLNHATVFGDALTPLARTYPAWVSILTGEYPKKTGVRSNLVDRIHFDLQQTLPAILHARGYQTLFATDETRFSNIDPKLGFDELVTPPIGFNDFLLGTFNDFPLSNLVVNTFAGQYLFPHSYGNRPVFTTYNPDSFLNLLHTTLERPRDKPLFLATHLCLAHFPYFWGGYRANLDSYYNYLAAVKRVDQQFYDLMKMLKQTNLLEHSIVVVLSDHGEAIELEGDRITAPDLFVGKIANKNATIPHFYPPSMEQEKVDQSSGHGTDVLGLPQYHTVLAFRFFGLNPQQVGTIDGDASLMDIKPTLLSLLGISAQPGSGNSLAEVILGTRSKVDVHRDFFTESDFSPEAVRSVHPETRKVLFEGIDFFQINPKTARLRLKPSMAALINSSRQYADFYGSWVLALYPQNKKIMMPVLVNLQTGEWTNDLRDAFAKQAPVAHMLQALKKFYGEDITFVENV
jgi:arylsulfatase A-like enzyme